MNAPRALQRPEHLRAASSRHGGPPTATSALRRRIAAVLADDERGNAIVEFIILAVVLLIPLIYLILTVFHLQNASFAAEGAARDAGRVMAASREEAAARGVAELAVQLALEDAGVDGGADVDISCSASPCLTAGASIHVTVTTEVALPLLPTGAVDALGARVQIQGSAVTIVDTWLDR